MEINLFDRKGKNTAYIDDDTIYTIYGLPVATIKHQYVYGESGKQIGMINDGWLIDMSGKCVCFSEDAESGPAKLHPLKAYHKPKKHGRLSSPRGSRKISRRMVWSNISVEEFFKEG